MMETTQRSEGEVAGAILHDLIQYVDMCKKLEGSDESHYPVSASKQTRVEAWECVNDQLDIGPKDLTFKTLRALFYKLWYTGHSLPLFEHDAYALNHLWRERYRALAHVMLRAANELDRLMMMEGI